MRQKEPQVRAAAPCADFGPLRAAPARITSASRETGPFQPLTLFFRCTDNCTTLHAIPTQQTDRFRAQISRTSRKSCEAVSSIAIPFVLFPNAKSSGKLIEKARVLFGDGGPPTQYSGPTQQASTGQSPISPDGSSDGGRRSHTSSSGIKVNTALIRASQARFENVELARAISNRSSGVRFSAGVQC